jgi:rRNA pseudouridine-1189 N-methylase Emg1 (Nep1/Mra1 family)
MKYRVHHFNIRMTTDRDKLELFLNGLEGEVVAIIPNVTPVPATFVNFLLIVERIFKEKSA